jgi:hypothetical protein
MSSVQAQGANQSSSTAAAPFHQAGSPNNGSAKFQGALKQSKGQAREPASHHDAKASRASFGREAMQF